MAPVVECVSADSVMRERTTTSRHSPEYESCADHARHRRSVSATSSAASTGAGGASSETPARSASSRRSAPRSLSNSPTVVSPSAVQRDIAADVDRVGAGDGHQASPCTLRTPGDDGSVVETDDEAPCGGEPSHGLPARAAPTRGLSSAPKGITSVTTTEPPWACHVVSSTSVSPRYERSARLAASVGASSQCPCSGPPSRDAKQAPESKRGTHSQSIEPLRDTRAAVRRSPMMA